MVDEDPGLTYGQEEDETGLFNIATTVLPFIGPCGGPLLDLIEARAAIARRVTVSNIPELARPPHNSGSSGYLSSAN
jgi:uracil-DNA glycosylase